MARRVGRAWFVLQLIVDVSYLWLLIAVALGVLSETVERNRLRVSPRHDRPDPWPRLVRPAGVVIMVLAAFGVFFVGLAATNARVGD